MLVAVRPPLFDNPTTRGLFDASTGVYWSVDTFATNTPHRMLEADDLSDGDFRDGQLLGARLSSGRTRRGIYSQGEGGAQLHLDAVQFCRILSGRAPAEGLLTHQVPC